MKKLVFIKKRFSIYGGGENYMKTLIDRLKEEFEITVLSNKWAPAEGIRFENVPILNAGSFLSVKTFDRNACAIIKKINPFCTISFERTSCQDIYRAGEGCHAEWLEIRSKVEPLYKHLSFKINPLHISLLNIEKKLFGNTKFIIANSKMVKGHIIKHYAVSEERITVIYNGVDLQRFKPENKDKRRKETRNALAIPEDSRLLLFVGSGFKRKGLKVFIDAVSLVKEPNIKALVIGKGNINKYKAEAEKKNIADRIIFLYPQEEIEKFYAAADLFVLPTLYDPFSNAALEAMASGIPVITTKNNGASELIKDGKEGGVINDPLDSKAIADKITFTLKNAGEMGSFARKKAEKHPIERAAGEFTEIIGKVLK